MSGTAIVPRQTVTAIVSQRDAALAAYLTAHEKLSDAGAAVDEARLRLAEAAPSKNSYNHHLDGEKAVFHYSLKLPTRHDYMATARRIVDTEVWARIIGITELERLMDKKAKDQFRQQLMKDPPEVTEDNVFATLETFIAEAGTIFRRGIAECFSDLDRRFKSHDGWEIGSRIILTNAFSEWGGWNYHRNHQDSMADVERVFLTLDGKPLPAVCEINHALSEARRGGSGPRQSEIETEYFLVRAFKNGNAHIWFKRDDLLVKVNQLLGEYYGAPIPEERAPEQDTGLNDPKTTLAKNYGFFPTPDAAAERVMETLRLHRDIGAPKLRVLEPSAGTGNLAKRAVKKGATVDCVEVQPGLATALRSSGLYGAVYTADFLKINPETTGLYDRVLMNPPFDRERDIDHVMHALKFLKPGGQLVAIMSAGTEFRNTRKSAAFRDLVESMRASSYDRPFYDLPPGSFSEVGTNCNTIVLSLTMPCAAKNVRAA